MTWGFKRMYVGEDVRYNSGILWIPKCIDGETRWLRFSEWTERFHVGAKEWVPWRWLD